MTGAAASEIGGETTASVFHYLKDIKAATIADIEAFIDVRLCIIDEISFAGYTLVLGKISENLQNYTECQEYQYGGRDMGFFGDFCQLETISGDCIYNHPYGIYWEQELNCLVELKGGHRFKNCPDMQTITTHWRDGTLTDEDRAKLNSRVINRNQGTSEDQVKMPDPTKTRFATYFNKMRCDINAEIFKNYLQRYHCKCTKSTICDSAIVIKANAQWATHKTALTFEQRKILFEEVSEANTKSATNQKCDPLLCLFDGSNLMGNENADVTHGIANGTTSIFKYAQLRPGTILQPTQIHGFWVNAVSVDDVEYLQLEWQDSSRFQGTFRVVPKTMTYDVYFPITVQKKTVRIKTKICLEQFPVVINFATTGHKLQGKSMLSLVIAQWSGVKNWAYVVISRVCSLKGLFLFEPIPDDIDIKPAPLYLEMIQRLRETIQAKPEQVAALKATYNFGTYDFNPPLN